MAKDQAGGQLPLSGYRVAELGSGAAVAYLGKLFADFGARVVKVEPPGGDPDRRVGPQVDPGDGARESAYFAWLNTNKQSVVCEPDDAARIAQIVGAADVLIDSRHGAGWDEGPLGQAALRRSNPDLTVISLSWFGESGPYRDFAATDATVRALGGCVIAIGPEEAPMLQPLPQAFAPTALSGFSAALASLMAGGGRRFEISALEVCAVIPEFMSAVVVATGVEERRWGINRYFPVFPLGIYPTKQGWLGVTSFSTDQWRGFCDLLGLPELHRNPDYATAPQRLLLADQHDAIVGPVLMTRTAREWADEGLARRVPLVVVPSMAELLATRAHREHGAFGTVRIGQASFEAPTLPQKLTATPPIADGAAPRAGEHSQSWRPSPPPSPQPRRAGLPLEGVRIVDLTMGWAGTLATRHLGDLGAEVIKVEGRAYPDWWRGADYSEAAIADRLYEKPLYFNWVNRNKLGITLDLTRPEGADLLRRLVRSADAVVENYSQGVLPSFGLDYATLKRERPDLVMVSMPAYGTETEWADLRAYGSTLEHGSGLPSVTGRADWPPTMSHVAYGDPNGGFATCPAVLAALLHRARTGEGQFVDLSQVELMFPLVAPYLIEQSITGRVSPRMGARHPHQVPHGIFPCDGHDAWVVIAATDDAAWRRLCEAIERPDLGADPALATLDGRRAEEDRLEAAIAAWTRRRSPDEAMEALQAKGVAAGAVRHLAEVLLYEPQLMARDYWQDVPRPHVDFTQQPSPVFREEGRIYPIRLPAPTLGQSTREVLTRILGLGEAELDRLEAEKIIGEEPIPATERKPRSSALLHEANAAE